MRTTNSSIRKHCSAATATGVAGMLLLLLSPLILIDHRSRDAGSSLFAEAFVIQTQQSLRTKGSRAPPSFVTIIPSSSQSSTTALQLRVAFQGESGAYSEKSTKELLGPGVMALGYTNFEDCFRAVKRMEVDYACLPIENSLGGSIHENYDLMLRYDLTICAEHEFRVQHCVLYGGTGFQQGNEATTSTAAASSSSAPSPSTITNLLHGTIQYAISHPQALAQCDNYLRSFNIIPIPTYDTAGSAKMIQEQNLPPGCTPDNTIAIGTSFSLAKTQTQTNANNKPCTFLNFVCIIISFFFLFFFALPTNYIILYYIILYNGSLGFSWGNVRDGMLGERCRR